MTNDVAVIERKPKQLPPKLKAFIDCDVMDEATLAEYREIANEVGVAPDDLLVEEFRVFLAKHDIPTFNLGEVVSYMDNLVKVDNPSGLGWHWCPVRAKDAKVSMRFGRPSVHDRSGGLSVGFGGMTMQSVGRTSPLPGSALGGFTQAWDEMIQREAIRQLGGSMVKATSGVTPASDYYDSGQCIAYTRTIPLHALKKIALVEKHFGRDKVAFLVTDYTTQPHVVVNPDPFLMAIVPNAHVGGGKGRFIIDVWDEPGFGIAQMVK